VLLKRIEEQLGVTVSHSETNGVADARRLFVDLARATNSQIELLAKLTGELRGESVETSRVEYALTGPDHIERVMVLLERIQERQLPN